jgi:riboflavin synthase alpha subunit
LPLRGRRRKEAGREMFTGLIEARGRVRSVRRTASGRLFRIDAPFWSELSDGDSVSVNGACLTVTRHTGGSFEAEAVQTTLAATTLGDLREGAEVNLERALRLSDRLGGHIVTGHVDGVGRVLKVDGRREGTLLSVELPPNLARFVAPRGSIALDGVSLTVADVKGQTLTVALIPETLRRTMASDYRAGDRVNVETDVLARQQARLSETDPPRGTERTQEAEAQGITAEKLRRLGFTE